MAVVEDEETIREGICVALRREHCEPHPFDDGQEAWDALHGSLPDLAILDLMMENMDSGFVLCHQIKHLYPDTPVILLTVVRSETGVDFSPRSKGAASWIKADVLLDKPIRPEQLRIEVQRLMA